jgi:hypothetical protein
MSAIGTSRRSSPIISPSYLGLEVNETVDGGRGSKVANVRTSDEYCPHCDNHFVLEAKTPSAVLQVEGEDVRKDSRMLKDERVKNEARRTIWDIEEAAEMLG